MADEEAPGTVVAAAADSDEQVSTEPAVDAEDLKKAIAASGSDAAIKAELEASRRARGHIPELQRRLDTAEKALARLDSIELSNKQLSERFDSLLTNLPDGVLPSGALAGLRPQPGDTSPELMAKIAELEERLNAQGKPRVEEPEEPAIAAVKAQWDEATTSVTKYATKNNLDPEAIPDAEWSRVLNAFRDDPSAAALEMMRYVDREVAAKARREERADAGKGGGQGSRTPRRGAITLEQLKGMTREEVAAIPAEERMAALAGG